MIYFFTKRQGENSGRKVENWLKERAINYETLSPYTLTSEHLWQMLRVSEEGFDGLILSKTRAKKSWQNLALRGFEYETLTVEQMIEFILSYPQILRTPILFDETRLLVGYHEERIRAFIPRCYREIFQARVMEEEKKLYLKTYKDE
ncbi:ArsC/Spx/MgsR family protein [Lactococcus lactis]|uniref:Regulatory protein spx n=1 Tax=Lactococcus lactis TaxID=1358 RepID=A0AAW5TGI9_9LACT|nr:ArsC/Spx/MgsR family protein [Lactococcus lactis]MCW2280144.1 regulatory protein spx [Lactococcus lactis]